MATLLKYIAICISFWVTQNDSTIITLKSITNRMDIDGSIGGRTEECTISTTVDNNFIIGFIKADDYSYITQYNLTGSQLTPPFALSNQSANPIRIIRSAYSSRSGHLLVAWNGAYSFNGTTTYPIFYGVYDVNDNFSEVIASPQRFTTFETSYSWTADAEVVNVDPYGNDIAVVMFTPNTEPINVTAQYINMTNGEQIDTLDTLVTVEPDTRYLIQYSPFISKLDTTYTVSMDAGSPVVIHSSVRHYTQAIFYNDGTQIEIPRNESYIASYSYGHNIAPLHSANYHLLLYGSSSVYASVLGQYGSILLRDVYIGNKEYLGLWTDAAECNIMTDIGGDPFYVIGVVYSTSGGCCGYYRFYTLIYNDRENDKCDIDLFPLTTQQLLSTDTSEDMQNPCISCIGNKFMISWGGDVSQYAELYEFDIDTNSGYSANGQFNFTLSSTDYSIFPVNSRSTECGYRSTDAPTTYAPTRNPVTRSPTTPTSNPVTVDPTESPTISTEEIITTDYFDNAINNKRMDIIGFFIVSVLFLVC